jgi:hypothetical protein
VASLPWYQQLIQHRDLKRILTPVQRKKYLLQPVVGYPRLLWSLWHEPLQFQRRIESAQRAMVAGAQTQGSENARRDGDR